MSDKPQFTAALAKEVIREIMPVLRPWCEPDRFIIAGSLRRRKETVGDVEIVYVPREGLGLKQGMLLPEKCNLADVALEQLQQGGILEPRPNKNDVVSMGQWNKLMRHVRTGLPVDLFATKESRWWMTVAVRTGPKDSNIRLAVRAKEQGLELHAYGGLTRHGSPLSITSEAHIWELLKLPFVEPWERE